MSQWKNFPFTVDGINFNSRVDLNSKLGVQVNAIPESLFISMNRSAILSLFGTPSSFTREEISARLVEVNAGGSYAFLELV